MNICRRILGEEVPFLDLKGKQGLFNWLANLLKKN
jgi:septum site-determining protein MinD